MKIITLFIGLFALSSISIAQPVTDTTLQEKRQDQITNLKTSLHLIESRQMVLQQRISGQIKRTESRCDSLEQLIMTGREETDNVRNEVNALKFRLVKLTNDHTSAIMSLRKENTHLKKINLILFILLVMMITGFFFYFRYRNHQLEYSFNQRIHDVSLRSDQKLNKLKMKWNARWKKMRRMKSKKKK